MGWTRIFPRAPIFRSTAPDLGNANPPRTPPPRGRSPLPGTRRIRGLLLLALLPVTTVCGLGPDGSGDWTPEEREAVDSLISGLGHLQAGITALNEGGGGPRPAGAVRERALEHLRDAERATAQVGDSVLSKIHPELPTYYRARLRRGIEDRIRSLEGGHLYRYSSAVTRLGEWAEWYDRTRDDWKLPRR